MLRNCIMEAKIWIKYIKKSNFSSWKILKNKKLPGFYSNVATSFLFSGHLQIYSFLRKCAEAV